MTLLAAALTVGTLAGCGNEPAQKSQAMLEAPTKSTSAPVPSATPSTSASSSAPAPTSSTSSPSTTAKPSQAPKATAKKTEAKKTAKATPSSTAKKVSRDQARPAVTFRTVKDTRTLEYKVVTKYDDDLAKGKNKVTRAGQAGKAVVTYRQTLVGKKVTRTQVLKTDVVKQPVSKLVVIGTQKAEPTPEPKPTPAPSDGGSKGGLDLRRSAMWDRIAQCESGGNWSINTGNGYFGGLQFNSAAWLGSGGGKFAPRADLASRAEQITIANALYDQRGLQPWGCRHAA